VYAKESNAILEVNENKNNEDYPLLIAVISNNETIVKLLLNYFKENSIIKR